QHARDVLDQPAAGDVGKRLDAAEAQRGEARSDIAPGGRQQRLAKAEPRGKRGGGGIIEAGLLDDAADQQKAVGMQTARGEAEYDEVIDAHRGEAGADRLVAARGDGDLQLGADAVGGRY